MAWQGVRMEGGKRAVIGMGLLVVPLVILGLSADWWRVSPLAPLLHQSWIPIALAAFVIVAAGVPIFRRGTDALANLRIRGELLIAIGALCGLALAIWQYLRLEAGAAPAEALPVWRDAAYAASLIAVARIGELAARTAPAAARPGSQLQARTLTIAAGDLIPVDAIVRDGRSEIQDPHGTDDIFPTLVGPGDRVHAGARNGDSALVVVPAREAHMPVDPATARARDGDHDLARLIGWASLGVLVLAGGAILWRVTMGPAFRDGVADILRLFMLAAPLGLGLALAAPAAEVLRMLRALGVELHRLVALERLCDVGGIVFGHRGVLIPDRPRVISVQTPNGEGGSELIGRAASVAQGGHDPWGRALLDLAVGYRMRLRTAHDYRAETGKGIAADIADKRTAIGTREYLEEQGVDCSPLEAPAAEALADGRRLRWVGELGAAPKVLGFVVFGAPSVAGAAQAVKNIDRLGLAAGWVADRNDPAHQALARHLKLDAILPAMPASESGPALQEMRGQNRSLLYVTAEPETDELVGQLAAEDIVLPFGRRAASQAPDADLAVARLDPRIVVDVVRFARRYRRVARLNIAIVFGVTLVVAIWPFLLGSARDLASYEIAVILLLIVSSLSLRAIPSTADEVDEE